MCALVGFTVVAVWGHNFPEMVLDLGRENHPCDDFFFFCHRGFVYFGAQHRLLRYWIAGAHWIALINAIEFVGAIRRVSCYCCVFVVFFIPELIGFNVS